MNNFIVVGDLHIRYTAPSFRKSTFYSELLNKIDQINILAKTYNADIICLGDFFNNYIEDYFESIAYDFANRVTDNWHSIIGNHDCKSSIGDLRGTSFGALVKLGSLKILNDKNFDVFHYYNRKDFTGRSNNKIAFIHDYIMPKGTKEQFEYKECQENDYDLVFCGHYHYPFDHTIGKTRYINPGSLIRLTISEVKLNRIPEVILVTKDKIEHVKLKCSSIEDIMIETNSVTKNFESKFVNMLLENNLTTNNSDTIVNLLKKNKVDENIINYIENKIKEAL